MPNPIHLAIYQHLAGEMTQTNYIKPEKSIILCRDWKQRSIPFFEWTSEVELYLKLGFP